MPCMCWYEPPEESKKLIKHHCQVIVDEIKRLRENGDPLGCEFNDVIKLLNHLYYGECPEKPLNKNPT